MERDPFGQPEFQAILRRELTRIGADDALHLGLASTVPITPAQLLAALAATTDGAGSDALLSNLAAEVGRASSRPSDA